MPSRQDAQPQVPWRHNVGGAEKLRQLLDSQSTMYMYRYPSDRRPICRGHTLSNGLSRGMFARRRVLRRVMGYPGPRARAPATTRVPCTSASTFVTRVDASVRPYCQRSARDRILTYTRLTPDFSPLPRPPASNACFFNLVLCLQRVWCVATFRQRSSYCSWKLFLVNLMVPHSVSLGLESTLNSGDSHIQPFRPTQRCIRRVC